MIRSDVGQLDRLYRVDRLKYFVGKFRNVHIGRKIRGRDVPHQESGSNRLHGGGRTAVWASPVVPSAHEPGLLRRA